MAWTQPAQAQRRVRSHGRAERDGGEPVPSTPTMPPDLTALYRAHFAFVWRSLRRLGVAQAGIDDAVHDVFLVVHQKLAEFVPGSPERPWLFGIARRVAQQARRKHWRERVSAEAADPARRAAEELDPQAAALRAETAQTLQRCLDTLDEDKRCVLILADLEQMSGPEIAAALEENLNTVYARLRTARQLFTEALRRERAREARR